MTVPTVLQSKRSSLLNEEDHLRLLAAVATACRLDVVEDVAAVIAGNESVLAATVELVFDWLAKHPVVLPTLLLISDALLNHLVKMLPALLVRRAVAVKLCTVVAWVAQAWSPSAAMRCFYWVVIIHSSFHLHY